MLIQKSFRQSLKILKIQVGEHGSSHLLNCVVLIWLPYALLDLPGRYIDILSVDFDDTWTNLK